MDKEPLFVGIDVAKHRLDGHLRPSGESFTIDDSEEEVTAPVERLVTLVPALIALEATGGLEVRLAAALAAAGLPVAVVNPRQVRSFARAVNRLAKTDRLDAKAIARFAEAVRPPARPLEDATSLALKALVARRRGVVATRGGEEQRRRATSTERVGQRLLAVIETFERQIVALDGDIDQQVKGSPAWRAREDLLHSVPGVGPITARTLIAELPEL